MLYNLQVKQKDEATLTYIFGTKMLKTLNVEILGKEGLENQKFNAFKILKYLNFVHEHFYEKANLMDQIEKLKINIK